MAIPVIMPRQGQSVESCIITKWHKNEGDTVKEGELLFSYETDKAAFDEEAKAEGTLLGIFYGEGEDVPVLVNVCVIGTPGEDISSLKGSSGGAQEPDGGQSGISLNGRTGEDENAGEAGPAGEEADTDSAGVGSRSGHAAISPRARNKAAAGNIDIRLAEPTGPYGRIIERDIDKAAEKTGFFERASIIDNDIARRTVSAAGADTAATSTATGKDKAAASEAGGTGAMQQSGYTVNKLSNIRKVIARAMFNSLATTAQLTLNSSFDASEILTYRKKIKEKNESFGAANITLNDMILYAVSRILKKHPPLNALLIEENLQSYDHVHLGVAVDTERGLMVPVIRDADTKSLATLSSEAKELIESCQKGTVNPDLLRGGTFTVTNLGTLGVESFTPVLNAPQTGILGVCNIVQRARLNGKDHEFYPAMGLSLTFDHRAVDGAPAARFLKDLAAALEDFTLIAAMG